MTTIKWSGPKHKKIFVSQKNRRRNRRVLSEYKLQEPVGIRRKGLELITSANPNAKNPLA